MGAGVPESCPGLHVQAWGFWEKGAALAGAQAHTHGLRRVPRGANWSACGRDAPVSGWRRGVVRPAGPRPWVGGHVRADRVAVSAASGLEAADGASFTTQRKGGKGVGGQGRLSGRMGWGAGGGRQIPKGNRNVPYKNECIRPGPRATLNPANVSNQGLRSPIAQAANPRLSSTGEGWQGGRRRARGAALGAW